MTDRPADTSPEAWELQHQIFARMTGEERVIMMFEMSDAARQISRDGLRARNPDATEAELERLWLELLHGPAIADQVLARRAALA